MRVMTGASIPTRQEVGTLGHPLLENVVKTSTPPRSPITQNTTSLRFSQRASWFHIDDNTHQDDEDGKVQRHRYAFHDGKLFVPIDVDERREASEPDGDQRSEPTLAGKILSASSIRPRFDWWKTYLWMQMTGCIEQPPLGISEQGPEPYLPAKSASRALHTNLSNSS